MSSISMLLANAKFPFFLKLLLLTVNTESRKIIMTFWAKKYLTIVVYLCGIYAKIIVKKLTLSNFNFEKFEFI